MDPNIKAVNAQGPQPQSPVLVTVLDENPYCGVTRDLYCSAVGIGSASVCVGYDLQ